MGLMRCFIASSPFSILDGITPALEESFAISGQLLDRGTNLAS
jgi:hypothetical protein